MHPDIVQDHPGSCPTQIGRPRSRSLTMTR
jgi:hypothetical protein